MEQIICKNSDKDGIESCDFFTGKPFKLGQGVAYYFRGITVSPEEAIQRGFVFDKDFKLLANNNAKVGEYIQSLGVDRGMNHSLYMKLFRQLANGLPPADIDEVRHEWSHREK